MQGQRIVLRSQPLLVEWNEAHKVFHINDYDGTQLWYVKNDFRLNCKQTVADCATGLMWSRFGSSSNDETQTSYIYAFNYHSIGGYSDWRMPTREELMSLKEPVRQSNGLYINPIFLSEMNSAYMSADESRDYRMEAEFGAVDEDTRVKMYWDVYFSCSIVGNAREKGNVWPVRSL